MKCKHCGGPIVANVLLDLDVPLTKDGLPDIPAIDLEELIAIDMIGAPYCNWCGEYVEKEE